MTNPPPSPPPSRGIILDILDRIFGWLDRPWKAFALAGLAVLVAFGWGGWLSRDALVDVWRMSAGRPVLKRSEVPKILAHLRAGADIVGLWSLNLSANAMNFEEAIGLHGKPWDFIPHRLPAIREPFGSAKGLSEIMAGHIVCRSVEQYGNDDLFNRRMIADNIHRLCLVPVPPAPNILIGILLLCWISDPDASSEEAALGLARETAAGMVSRWE
jgi:hypothetical protein